VFLLSCFKQGYFIVLLQSFMGLAACGGEGRKELLGTPQTPAKGYVPGPPDPVPSALLVLV
jgi:hypothetical protein